MTSPLEGNTASSLPETNSCSSMSLEIGSGITDQCAQCCDVRLYQTRPDTGDGNSVDADQRTQTLSYCSVCLDPPLESDSSARGTQHILNTRGGLEQRSKRKRKGRHHILLENSDLHLHTDLAIDAQVSHAGDQTYYSCLIVDEGLDETMTELKVHAHTLSANWGSFIHLFIYLFNLVVEIKYLSVIHIIACIAHILVHSGCSQIGTRARGGEALSEPVSPL